jgi:hypothetical protein
MATPTNPHYSTYASAVKLAPGEVLHFQQGKGYYAAPKPAAAAPVAPFYTDNTAPHYGTDPNTGLPAKTPISPKVKVTAPPPPPVDPYAALTQAQIDARATTLAQAGLTPQQDEIRRQQAVAAAQATADEQAITGFRTAAGTILQGIAPQVGAGYEAAATEQGQLGQGMATGVRDDLAAAQAQDQSFAVSQGQTLGAETVNPNATHDVIYGLNGQIPGESLASQGAAAQAWAAEQPAISLNAGREELDARMAQARSTNDGYAQQLIQLAATFPGLKAQALSQLNQYEIDKANYRTSLLNAQTQAKAEKANEVLAGIKQTTAAANTAQEFQYKWAQLNFKSQQQAAKAAQAGKTIDVGASRLLGHVVYKDGSEDTSIKVQQSTATTPAQQAKRASAKASATASTSAYKVASSLYGKLVPNKNVGTLTGGKGKYMADPSAKGAGVFPPPYKNGPRTTNSLALAARTGQGAANYADAYAKTYAAIGGDALLAQGLSKEQVMTIVKKALRAAGWRPSK